MRELILKLIIPNDDYDDVHQDLILEDYILRKGVSDAELFILDGVVDNNPEIIRLKIALEKLAKLGNGDQYGNSDGNMIAQAALKGE